jgi:hypothetical protein
MPALTLVVCVHNQREFLQRLLQKAKGCYDDLVVIHDGPDETRVRAVVEATGGRFFERPRAFQQEPHLPFAFGEARHDWILHFDADEFPSEKMKEWLSRFRTAPDPEPEISGFTCIWPLWNGRRTTSNKWPRGRIFLFDRRKATLFGMAEQAVVPDGQFRPVDLILHHQPKRNTHGFWNMIVRAQTRRVAKLVARCLLGKPTDLVCWRWESETWPVEWEQIRRHPLRTAFKRLIRWTLRGFRDQWRFEKHFFPTAAIGGPLFHALICLEFWRVRRQHLRKMVIK